MLATPVTPRPIPACAGIGLRFQHQEEFLATKPRIGWLEVHSENYFSDGGPHMTVLETLRQDYPISLHGVGLSLGSSDELSQWHLAKLKKLINQVAPGLVSEHLSWSSVGHKYLNDLIPLPYTEEAIKHISARIEYVQDYLNRRILIENISSYLQFNHSTISEWEFLVAIAKQSGCGILLDINNVYVNASNYQFDPRVYLKAIPVELIGEIHLAGYTIKEFPEGKLILDTHNQPVSPVVWQLYRDYIEQIQPYCLPTLIEWDADLPPLVTLIAEAAKANALMENYDAYTTTAAADVSSQHADKH